MSTRQLLYFGAFISALWISSAVPSRAQTITPDSAITRTEKRPVAATITSTAVEDTVQAITMLYSRRRMGGAGWILGGTLGGIRALTSASQGKTVSGSYGTVVVDEGADGGVIAAGVGMILLVDGYGLSKILRFSAAKQAALIADVRAGKALPANVRQRLKPRFFIDPIIRYKKVKTKSLS